MRIFFDRASLRDVFINRPSLRGILILSALFTLHPLNAKTFVDFEADPIPLVNIHILIPSSRLLASDKENLALTILSECYQHGTMRLNKQQFQDALAKYGLSVDVNPSYRYLSLDVSFPLKDGKIPEGVFALTKESYDSPRIDAETYDQSKKLLKANYVSSIEHDGGVLVGSLQRYFAIKMYDLKPTTIETYDAVTIDDVKNMHQNFYRKNGDAWVGIVGPEYLKSDLANFAHNLIPSFDGIEMGMLKERLVTGYAPVQKNKLPSTFILVDKADRAQIYYGMLMISDKKTTSATELPHDFTDYVLGGANSLFFRRIRFERGIAYSVGNLMSNFYDYPIYSLYANPQRSRQTEAFEVLAQLMQDTFKTTSIIKSLPPAEWNGRLISYQNSIRQEGATAEGRLARRTAVVNGDISYDHFKTPPEKLKVTQKEAEKSLLDVAANSTLLYGAIGDAKELEPLIQKNFPGIKILKVPYKDTLSKKWYSIEPK